MGATAMRDERSDDRHTDDWRAHGGHTHQRHAADRQANDHRAPAANPAADLGMLALRATVGGLLMGHGAQKLFGWFGGYGLEGTAGWLESMGFKPGKQWAMLAGASEFGGGALTALGLLHPLGPIATAGAMAIATLDAHAGKPIWATEGGAELPVTNMAAAAALAVAGPGAFSLDRALGIRIPKEVVALAALAVAAGVVAAETREKPAAQPAPAEEPTAAPAPADDAGMLSSYANVEEPGIPPRAADAGGAAFH